MPAYCLFDNVEVLDPDGLAEYARRAAETVRRHGGRYLVIRGAVAALEGAPGLHEPVLIEFDDLAAAHAWYDSPEYRPLRDLRHRSVRTTAVILSSPDEAAPA